MTLHRPRRAPVLSTDAREAIAARGYVDEFAHLRICRRCYGLFEQDRPDSLNQPCACEPRGPAWPGFDFNERARLCTCCALSILPSGSKWSPYLCERCRWMAMAVTLWEGQLVFPIGRHSLMHTWVPNTRPATLRGHAGDAGALADSVHRVVVNLTKGGDRLRAWAPVIIRQHVERLRLRGSVYVSEYLLTCVRRRYCPILQAFSDLCDFTRALAPDSPTEH